MYPKKDAIFVLLKTLSRGEKRAFKIYASKYSKDETNMMVWLFDTISNQNEYNEKQVKQKLSKQNVKTPLAVLKTKLFTLVLKSVSGQTTLNVNGHPIFSINEKVEYANILYHRGLFAEANNYLEKACKLAVKHENFEQILFLLKQKIEVAKKHLPSNKCNNLLSKIAVERQVILEKLQNQWAYNKLRQDIVTHYRKYDEPQNEEEVNAYANLFENELLTDSKKALSVLALMNYYNIQTFRYNILGDKAEALKHTQELVRIVEENKDIVQFEPDWIFSALNNVMTLAIELKDNKLFDETLNKLNTVSTELKNLTLYNQKRIFEIKYTLLYSKFIRNGLIDEGLNLIDELKKGIEQYKSIGLSADRVLRFYFSIALLYYYKGNSFESQKWLYKIIEVEEDTALTVMCFARVLDVMLDFESGDYELLNHKLISVTRFLKKYNRLLQIESIIIKKIKQLIKVTDESRKRVILQKLAVEISESDEKNPKSRIMFYLRIGDWVQKNVSKSLKK